MKQKLGITSGSPQFLDEDERVKWPEFNEEVDMENPRLEVGMEFKNAIVFPEDINRVLCQGGCGLQIKEKQA